MLFSTGGKLYFVCGNDPSVRKIWVIYHYITLLLGPTPYFTLRYLRCAYVLHH